MSTPRPSEADVEALSEALRQIDAAGSVQTYERHARAILASDWLVAREAAAATRALEGYETHIMAEVSGWDENVYPNRWDAAREKARHVAKYRAARIARGDA